MFFHLCRCHMAHQSVSIWFGWVKSKPAMLGFFLVKKGQFLGHFLPFLGVADEQKGPNTCFPMYVDVIWPIKAFPFGLVESKAGLPCLAFFGQKRALFRQTPAKTGGPESKKKVHHQVSYMWPACRTPKPPVWNINMAAIDEKCQK